MHLGDRQAFLDHRHLVALLAVEVAHFVGVLHRHDAHAVGAGVGLDDDERLAVDAVFRVFGADLRRARASTWPARQSSPVRSWKLILPQTPKYGSISHGIDADERWRILGDPVVGGEVAATCAAWPSRRAAAGSRAARGSCRIAGTPADRSLLSSTTQGSKSVAARGGCRCARSGSSVSVSPLGRSIVGRCRDLRHQLPMRTLQPGLAQDVA